MMNKIFLFLLFMSFPTVSLAAPAYGTKLPHKNQFYFGGQTYFVEERQLEGNHGEQKSLQHFMLVSYGIFDWLSLDLKGGGGYIRQQSLGKEELDYPTYVGGGYGFRLQLFEQGKWKSVFGFQHISIHPYSIEVENVKHKAVLDDWQLSLLLSHAWDRVIPFVGARFSRMDYIHWENDQRERVLSKDRFGLILGTDIILKDNVWINIETGLIDSTSVAASFNFHF